MTEQEQIAALTAERDEALQAIERITASALGTIAKLTEERDELAVILRELIDTAMETADAINQMAASIKEQDEPPAAVQHEDVAAGSPVGTPVVIEEARWMAFIAEQQRIRNENDRLTTEVREYHIASDRLSRAVSGPRCPVCHRPLSSETWPESMMVCRCGGARP